jgi:HAD superfamily hydrolase (TIGR01509 family)
MSRGQDGYQAALFDMDGVLVDTTESVVRFWRDLAGEHGGTIADDDLVAHVYGRTADDTLDALFPVLSAKIRQGVHARLLAYEEALTYTGIAGAAALLRELKRYAIPAVLVTSGSTAKVERVIEHLGIAGLLAAYVTAADITRGKPDPEPYLAGARKVGVPAARCVAFEDAIGGVRSAVGAGATCVGIADAATAPRLLAAGAQAVVPDLTAIRLRTAARPATRAGIRLEVGEHLRLPFVSSGRTKEGP